MIVLILIVAVIVTQPAYLIFVGLMKFIAPSLSLLTLLLGACIMIFEPYLAVLVFPTLFYLGFKEG